MIKLINSKFDHLHETKDLAANFDHLGNRHRRSVLDLAGKRTNWLTRHPLDSLWGREKTKFDHLPETKDLAANFDHLGEAFGHLRV